MSLLVGQPHLQYCEKCGWKKIVKSDCLFFRECPDCDSELKLKPFSQLSLIERAKLKIYFLGQKEKFL